ncbi:MAG TPA: aromatic ring-hydroxylating dioxygenase subunit alpha, partial [Beijerinckiaceae bacterium]|nr:aromatic ring-hydroxylating dioxygenase subunit alpha [Beijerinckiaceae bacterium]
RCPYHGWEFNREGHCTDQPNEPETSSFKSKVTMKSYPVENLGGLLWAYLGPLPAPLIPRLDGLVAEGTVRTLGYAEIPCNWLQIMENSLDIVHTEWCHGALTNYLREAEGVKTAIAKHHLKYGWSETDYGIVKRRVLEGHTEEDDDWTIGHPIYFPCALASSNEGDLWREFRFRFRVPIDDTHTMHYWYAGYVPPRGKSAPQKLLDRMCVYPVKYLDDNGEYLLHEIHTQDIMVWITQGAIAQRHLERLGTPDKGITMYRRMLLRELNRMEEGHDPMNVLRDSAKNEIVRLPCEREKAQRVDGFEVYMRRNHSKYLPIIEDVIDVMRPVLPTAAE